MHLNKTESQHRKKRSQNTHQIFCIEASILLCASLSFSLKDEPKLTVIYLSWTREAFLHPQLLKTPMERKMIYKLGKQKNVIQEQNVGSREIPCRCEKCMDVEKGQQQTCLFSIGNKKKNNLTQYLPYQRGYHMQLHIVTLLVSAKPIFSFSYICHCATNYFQKRCQMGEDA